MDCASFFWEGHEARVMMVPSRNIQMDFQGGKQGGPVRQVNGGAPISRLTIIPILPIQGGGNSNIFYFHFPNPGEDDSHFDLYFQRGGETTN